MLIMIKIRIGMNRKQKINRLKDKYNSSDRVIKDK